MGKPKRTSRNGMAFDDPSKWAKCAFCGKPVNPSHVCYIDVDADGTGGMKIWHYNCYDAYMGTKEKLEKKFGKAINKLQARRLERKTKRIGRRYVRKRNREERKLQKRFGVPKDLFYAKEGEA